MRISDWSSDVCSSDLARGLLHEADEIGRRARCLLIIARLRIGAIVDEQAHGIEEGLVADQIPERVERPRALGIDVAAAARSEEHTSELQSLMRNSYAVFCLKNTKKNKIKAYRPTVLIYN